MDKKSKRTRNAGLNHAKFRIVAVLAFAFWGAWPGSAAATNLYFYPSSGEYTVGETLSVSLYVSTDQPMNAAAGTISFSKDKLEIISLSKQSSILPMWVREPSFSNSTGTVSFEGVMLNPGFIGTSGKIITLNFQAKAEGSAYLNFSSGLALANNGTGTNILTNSGKAQFNLKQAAPTPINGAVALNTFPAFRTFSSTYLSTLIALMIIALLFAAWYKSRKEKKTDDST